MVPRGNKAAVSQADAGRSATPLDGEIYRLVRCGHMLGSLLREILDESYLRKRCPHPLTRVQFCLLKLTSVNANLQASEVARYLGVSPAAITKNVDKLERLDLVRRTSSEHDRRAILLSSTDEGRRLVHEFEEFKARRVLPALEHLGARDIDEVCDLLESVCYDLCKQGADSRGFCLRCAGYYEPECSLRFAQGHCALSSELDEPVAKSPGEMA
jgi:DNA-binding MarR family transcriptional regulator